MYLIVGHYEGRSEVIDRVSDYMEAQELAGEYAMAFGTGWSIDVVEA